MIGYKADRNERCKVVKGTKKTDRSNSPSTLDSLDIIVLTWTSSILLVETLVGSGVNVHESSHLLDSKGDQLVGAIEIGADDSDSDSESALEQLENFDDKLWVINAVGRERKRE